MIIRLKVPVPAPRRYRYRQVSDSVAAFSSSSYGSAESVIGVSREEFARRRRSLDDLLR